MKRYKDLTAEQQRQARELIIEINLDKLVSGSKIGLSNRQKKLLDDSLSHSLCGCVGCKKEVKQHYILNNEFKEFLISESQKQAEGAYFAEQDDTVLDFD